MKIKYYFIIPCLFCILFISGKYDIDFKSEKAQIIKCGDWETIKTNPFILLNNVWGKGNIKKYEQCLFIMNKKSQFPLGWRWKWPNTNPDIIKGYPDITFGWQPWSDKSTTSKLPIQISKINNITVTYDIEKNIKGKYNFSFDLWITKKPGRTNPPEDNIVREIMIWLDYNKFELPSGWYAKKVKIDGEIYKFYKVKNLKTENYTRDYLAFLKETPEYKGNTKIHEFIKFLIKNNHINKSEYLENIDLGNEVLYGQGEIILNKYNISVK